MTIEQIHKLAEERYKLGKGACRLERIKVRLLKEAFINKLKQEHGITAKSQ